MSVGRHIFICMDKGRSLGVVGGLGVGATVHYYKQLAAAHEKRMRRMDLAMVHAQTDRVFSYIKAGNREGMAEYLCHYIERLKDAGAEVAAIPAISPHYCIRELIEISPLPLFNVFDALNKEIKQRALKRVGLFGTRFVTESSMFGMLEGVEVIKPKPDEIEYVNRIYLDLVIHASGTEEQFQGLTELAWKRCKRDNLDAIILAGTDFTVLFDEGNTEFPRVDCATVHLRAIVKGLLH
jgi:aspartate racemase